MNESRHSRVDTAGPALLAAAAFALTACAMANEPEIVTFSTQDGATIEAALFAAEGGRAAVFAHGAVFNKESWYPTARRVQDAGVAALSINFRGYGDSTGPGRPSREDILGAIDFLVKRGYREIALVGGSMGGAIVLDALANDTLPKVTRVVLLAPAGGEPIPRKDVDKLFVVSEGDRLRPAVERLHAQSAGPKKLHTYSGDAHAQHLFKTEHAEDLRRRMVDFLTNEE